ncbi:MAG TPA: phosphoribosylformylglycinamidine synthase subunit PurS [Phycisphaerales bacterium]|nr:phosphoribosylformylglycinamidine synthase subunit PurS [Phycisphaerales bacterium]
MPTLHRIEVRTRPNLPDPRAHSVKRRAEALGFHGLREVNTAKVYLVEADLDGPMLDRVLARLLSDPVTEQATVGAAEVKGAVQTIEVHPLPGVMDPAAQSVMDAIKDLTGSMPLVSTGSRFDLAGVSKEQAETLAKQVLANPVIHQISAGPWQPKALPRGHGYKLQLRSVPILGLSEEELTRLSRDAHLFLSLDEMRAVQAEFRRIGRDPTDIELETLAQTWSEHCVHKTLKSTIRYTPGSGPKGWKDPIPWGEHPNHTVNADGSVTIGNLLKSTVAAATFELIDEGIDWTLSVFKDNSGVIALDDQHGVCIKVETHNHPSALEPYGGAATGAGGCIRDVIGTGLGAKPIANTDVFCVANPGMTSTPPGTLHPRRILSDVVAGVRDYGNRMGIPTLNGAVYFDDRYVGNPLVFCGCIGLIPRHLIKGKAKNGDRIIALGGRTGRDGIHGATFSSAELEEGHSDEFSHAVQIGNAIEEKRLLDAILRARDFVPPESTSSLRPSVTPSPLFNAITDCGAGGFSSAVGEMGGEIGAEVHLERAPLKYAGLSYTEIWISEAQERMVLAVPPENLPHLQRICLEEHVELADLGHFGTEGAELVLFYEKTEVGRLSMHFLHEGIPTPTREATWALSGGSDTAVQRYSDPSGKGVQQSLLSLLSHPTIASKHWIIRQYDHEVQGNTILKPLVGPGGRGPGDGAVLEPVSGSGRGIAIGCGLATPLGDPQVAGSDPYWMAIAAIDECVRNIVCVGGNPDRTAILDNFCWPSCAKPENLGSLVRAAEGCYSGAKAYRTPFVSGKDSLNNQLRYTDPATGKERVIEIPPTLLITGLAHVTNVSRCVTMDAKKPGNVLVLIGVNQPQMAGSLYAAVAGARSFSPAHDTILIPDLTLGPATARAVAQCIQDGLVQSAHDASDGGLLVAIAEMLIATTGSTTASQRGTPGASSGAGSSLLSTILGKSDAQASTPPLGAELTISDDHLDAAQLAFNESASRYILEVRDADLPKVRNVLRDFGGVRLTVLGRVNDSGRLTWQHADVDVGVSELAQAWLNPLDW